MTRLPDMPREPKTILAPQLRFPEFRGGPNWSSNELHTIADPVSERAENEGQNNILTLSGEHGLVLQSEYFGKQTELSDEQITSRRLTPIDWLICAVAP